MIAGRIEGISPRHGSNTINADIADNKNSRARR